MFQSVGASLRGRHFSRQSHGKKIGRPRRDALQIETSQSSLHLALGCAVKIVAHFFQIFPRFTFLGRIT